MSDKRITDLPLITELTSDYYTIVDNGELTARKYNITKILEDQEKLATVEEGAQANVVETIEVNGQALPVDSNKAVDISIPIVTVKYNGTDLVPDIARAVNVEAMDFVENPTEDNILTTDSNGQAVDSGVSIDELVDIRTGVDGTVYQSAGASVRGQVTDLINEQESMSSDIAQANTSIENLNAELFNYVNGGYVEDGVAYFMHDDEELFQITGIGGGGGGGGGGNNAIIKVTNTSGWLNKIVGVGATVKISVNWSSLEENIPTGNGTLTVRANNVVKANYDVAQGDLTIDISNYLASGANKIRVTLTDVYGNTSSIIFSVQVMNLELTSSFDADVVYTAGEAISFAYIPTGNATKTVHFVVDDVDVAQTVVTTSGRQQTQTLDGLAHGSHSILVYFTAEIDGATVSSNELYYDIIVANPASGTAIISSTYRATTAIQYQTIVIPYKVYTPNSLTSLIHLYANGDLVSTLTVDRTEQIWSYRPDETGELIMKIVSGGVEKDFTITVADSGIDIDAETNDLALYLTARGRSNNEQDPSIWEYDDISATLTDFNYVSDGWISDSNGYTALRVSGDARVTIPYQVFAQDFRTSGKTIEIEFATRDILNYDSVIMSCYSGDRGFELTAQRAFLKSEQSEIFTQYKEDEHVRVSFVVEKRSENRLIYIYTNGIMSGVVQYPANDDFSQISPVGISIGSNYCTTNIYCIRIYDNDLTRYQILENWIADTQDIEDLLYRYNHNNVYDEYGQIIIEKLPADLPYMIVSTEQLPQYKGDKKSAGGTYVDPNNPSKSFTFSNAQIDVQGTSSQYYARKNYKVKFRNGFDMTQSGTHEDTFAMRSDSIGTNTFTFKADVASSEGANNVELVRLYNEACPYKTPSQEENEKVRQGIDGFPIVMFWNNGTTVSFLGKYNFNNDKGTPEVFGLDEGDESWEVLNNTSNRVIWKSDDYSGTDWQNDFESRYPEDYFDPSKLAAFASWIVTTDTEAATGDALPSPVTYDGETYTNDTAAYRLAKFKAELENYVELDSAMFYYLFTELFLMVDSRAKNMFPSFIGSEV